MNQIGKKMRVSLAITVILVSIIGLSSCEKYTFSPPQVNPNDTVYYQTDIQSIFNSDCISCHGGATSPNLTAAKSYNALTKGGYVTPNDETCRLYVQLTSASHTPRSTDTQKQQILIWLNQGALNNKPL